MRLLCGCDGPHFLRSRHVPHHAECVPPAAANQCRKYADLAENRNVDCGPSNVIDNNINNDSKSPGARASCARGLQRPEPSRDCLRDSPGRGCQCKRSRCWRNGKEDELGVRTKQRCGAGAPSHVLRVSGKAHVVSSPSINVVARATVGAAT